MRVAIKTKNPSEVMFIAWKESTGAEEGRMGRWVGERELFSECRRFVRMAEERVAAGPDRCRIHADVANR